MEKTYDKLKKLSEKHNEAEYQAEIPLEVVEKYSARALTQHARDFEMQGFRKGKVPDHIVREHVDEMALLEAAADQALRDAVREILADEKVSIIGSPRLTITKIALKNPIEFKIMLALYPEVKLPDYKKIGADIAGRKDTIEVADKDMEAAIASLLKMTGEKELTDESVKQFGPFTDLADFKEKLKENLAQGKEMESKEARREEIMRAVVEKSKVEIPQMLIDEEWYAFEDHRNAELEQAKLPLEDYLKQSNKTAEALEKEERALIEERIKTSMVFREIQKQEAIEPTEKEIQTNIAHLKLRYKDRSEEWLRQTAEAVIIQEKIFAILGLPLAVGLQA